VHGPLWIWKPTWAQILPPTLHLLCVTLPPHFRSHVTHVTTFPALHLILLFADEQSDFFLPFWIIIRNMMSHEVPKRKVPLSVFSQAFSVVSVRPPIPLSTHVSLPPCGWIPVHFSLVRGSSSAIVRTLSFTFYEGLKALNRPTL
jgi:hypothetical protein